MRTRQRFFLLCCSCVAGTNRHNSWEDIEGPKGPAFNSHARKGVRDIFDIP